MAALATEQYYQETIAANSRILESIGAKNEEGGIWVFGYGSLVWKVDFRYSEQKIGFVYGHARRFWQQSRDHRGTPENPGLVATLVPVEDQKQIVWGMMYYIPPSYLDDSMKTLNFREKDGYTLKTLKCYERGTNECHDVITYVSNTTNNEPLENLAQQIARSVGPSGPNTEYLFNMAEALREKNIVTEDDEKHLIMLEIKVREILENNKHL